MKATFVNGDVLEYENKDIVAEVEGRDFMLKVIQLRGSYHVEVNGVIRHPGCTSDAAIRAMAVYLQTFVR
jgi:hypothetical protein